MSYSILLEKYDLKYRAIYPWLYVGNIKRIQGWKIHLSTIVSEAQSLLDKILPFLLEKKTPFKIIQNRLTLEGLNEGNFGITQVGKCVTIYPESDTDSRKICDDLVDLTKGFHGPKINTDLRIGDIVYVRYGGFNPVVKRNRLGETRRFIYNNDGDLVQDSYSIPFVFPKRVHNPFKDIQFGTYANGNNKVESKAKTSKRILGPGYLLVDVLKNHTKGATFRALDIRSRKNLSIVIIKEGRSFCLSDIHDRDIRNRLKYQLFLHKKLYGIISIPRAYSYFENNENGYLVMESLDGESFESWIQKFPWNSSSKTNKKRILLFLIEICNIIKKLHDLGYIHRDVTPSNIFITNHKRVYLLDLETMYSIKEEEPSFGAGTPGFISPQQINNEKPLFQDDIFSLGCMICFILTGIEPRRILFIDEENRASRLEGLIAEPLPKQLLKTVVECLALEPAKRPSLQALIAALDETLSCLTNNSHNQKKFFLHTVYQENSSGIPSFDIIERGKNGFLDHTLYDINIKLFLSPKFKEQSFDNPLLISIGDYEPQRSINRGIAGILYVMSCLSKLGYANHDLRLEAARMTKWLLNNNAAPDYELPGLYFGEAGVAVSLAHAVSSKLIKSEKSITGFIADKLSGTLDWPDLTHGAAGQGLAVLNCAASLNDAKLLKKVHRYASYLVSTQSDDGSWAMPFGEYKGIVYSGFAHGVAGILYFLSVYNHLFKNVDIKNTISKSIEWLIGNSHEIKGGTALEWEFSNNDTSTWKWWCNGSPGIAIAFLNLFEITGDLKYEKIAKKALNTHVTNPRFANLSLCHGLSGLGEIYLDAYKILGDKIWLDRANQIAKTIFYMQKAVSEKSSIWLTEDPNFPTADLMIGTGGILHFFLKYFNNKKIVFPLLLNSEEMTRLKKIVN